MPALKNWASRSGELRECGCHTGWNEAIDYGLKGNAVTEVRHME